MAKAKVDEKDQAALNKPAAQVESELLAQVGAVPLIDPNADSEPELRVTAGTTRPEDELILGEVIAADGQFHQEIVSASGTIDGRNFDRSQVFTTGRQLRFFKCLIPTLETPQDEEIMLGGDNEETEAALAGDMSPARKKMVAMGCTNVVLRGQRLVFLRQTRKYRFIPVGHF
jgi:hypothetical protein